MVHDIAIRQIRLTSDPHAVAAPRVGAAGEVRRRAERAFLVANSGRRIHNLSRAAPYIIRL